MSKVVLLIVGAAWVAVLLPPFLRSRMESRPTSSVSDFRNQLHSLQRAVPRSGGAPMRAMARPLVSSRHTYAQHPVGYTQARQVQVHGGAISRTYTPGQLRPTSRREFIHRRRQTVVTWLVGIVGISMFLAFTTANQAMIYLFVMSALVLCGYCYILVQIRRNEQIRAPRNSWYDVA